MKKPILFVAFATLCSAAFPTAPVSAQDMPAMFQPQISPMIAGHAAALDHAAQAAGGNRGGRNGRVIKGRTTRAGSSGRRLRGSTRFRVSRATRARMVAAWFAKMRAIDPKGAAGLEREFAGRSPIKVVEPQIAKYGLRTDDAADSVAVYLVAAWYGARGSNQDPPRSLVRATRNQMHIAMLQNPRFASASDAGKQQLADSVLLQTILDQTYINAGKKSAAEMAQAKKLIRQAALKTFKLDVLKLKLTAKGLRA